MRQLLRMSLTGICAIATHYFVYWVPFSLVRTADTPWWIPFAGSVICALAVATFVWKQLASIPQGLASSVALGAVLVGGIGFVGGFFGPIIFMPTANQGPLLGIFITGPLGTVLGAIGGAVFWFARRSKRLEPAP